MLPMIRVGKRKIGEKEKVFIIAEISGNHNHDIKRALRIIDEAADPGADAIKLQTYTADTITLDSDRPEFIVTWQGKKRTLYELYQEAYTPWAWHKRLFAHAKKRGLVCFSTPFDPTAVAFLEKLKTPLYKVASFEVVDIPLLEAIGKTKKPVIMCRGMATRDELTLAVQALRKFGTKDIILLQCVSSYPARPEDMHLKNIPDLMKRFNVPVGLSDHTLTNDSAIASVALGARVIEKHMTLKRADGGVDSGFSLEPKEFAALVASVRIVEKAVTGPEYGRGKGENIEAKSRKSLFASTDIKKGERFTSENVRSIRPGAGMAPKYYRSILGKRAARDLKRATPLRPGLIAKKK